MTEILLEVTTEEIRSASFEVHQQSKGKSFFLTFMFYLKRVRLVAYSFKHFVTMLIMSCINIGFSQESASATVLTAFEIPNSKTW